MVYKLLASIFSSRKNGLLRLRKASSSTRLECIGGECGLCCSVIGSIVVTKEETTNIPQYGIIEDNDNFQLKCTEEGCVFLKNNYCSIYEHRPRGCKEYPWYNIDGKLFYDLGCPGIRFDRDEHPNPEDLREVTEYLTPFPKFLQRILVWVFKHW